MLTKITFDIFNENTSRYSLISGKVYGAPRCPYGNNYKWIGYDLQEDQFVRFTTSVFKKLIDQKTKR